MSEFTVSCKIKVRFRLAISCATRNSDLPTSHAEAHVHFTVFTIQPYRHERQVYFVLHTVIRLVCIRRIFHVGLFGKDIVLDLAVTRIFS